jgi:hypothetical protein
MAGDVMALQVDESAWKAFMKRLRRLASRQDVEEVTEKSGRESANFLLHKIQDNIHQVGLIETGAYLASWRVVQEGRRGYTVFTDDPAAFRHEFGFVGVDALGRSYHDSPRPHVRPAIADTLEKYQTETLKGIQELWDKS